MLGIRRAFKPLYVQVIVGAALGIFLGVYAPDIAVQFKPLGDGFVKLPKMLAAPIIFTTVVVGIAETEDMKSVGRIGSVPERCCPPATRPIRQTERPGIIRILRATRPLVPPSSAGPAALAA